MNSEGKGKLNVAIVSVGGGLKVSVEIYEVDEEPYSKCKAEDQYFNAMTVRRYGKLLYKAEVADVLFVHDDC